MPKNILKSKTFWWNALTLAAQGSGLLSSFGVSPNVAFVVSNLANIGLRTITSQPVTLGKTSPMMFVFLAFFILVPSNSLAQTGPQVQWDQGNVQSATQAQGLIYKLYVTPPGATTPNAPVTLTSILCGGTAPSVQCATVLPAAASGALITGAKSELTATDVTSGLESAKSNPFTSPASVPINLRVTP